MSPILAVERMSPHTPGMTATSRRFAALGLIVALVTLAGFALGLLLRPASSTSQVQEERPVEGRLTGGFEYAPYREGSSRVTEAQTPETNPEGSVRGPDESTLVTAEDEGSAARLRRVAVRQLLEGRVDQAVRKLERAVRLAPDDPRCLSDLAAARLDRARQTGDVYGLMLALEAASRAVEIDPRLEEARFNLALILERVFLREAAQSAWESYLQLDHSSGWAGEARMRLATLSAPKEAGEWKDELARLRSSGADERTIERIASRFPQETQEYVVEVLLGSWADALAEGRTAAAGQALSAAERIGRALAKLKGDFLPADAVAAIGAARNAPVLTAALMEGHRTYREARSLYTDRKPSRAEFERARSAFQRGKSPVAALAALYPTVDLMQRNESRAALAILDQIAREGRYRRYPGLLSKAYWIIGLVYLGEGDPAASLAAYREALSLAGKAGGQEDVAGIHAVLAEVYQYLGQPQRAWGHTYQALQATPWIQSPRRLAAITTETAEVCLVAGQWRAERWFRDEAVRVSEDAGEPVALSHALLRRGEVFHRLGDRKHAAENLAAARRVLEQIEDDILRRRNEADLLIAEVLAGQAPAGTVESLERAFDLYARDDHFFLRRLYLARARAHLILGNEQEAEADLRRGVEESELQRARLNEEDLRISFLDQSGDLYHELIRLLSRNPDRAEEAFDISERAHARALLDRLGPIPAESKALVLAGSVEPGTSREIRAALPEGVALVEYVLLEDRLLAWVLHRSSLHLVDASIEVPRVVKLVERLQEEMSGETLSALHDALIRPLSPRLHPGDHLVIVPDGELHKVPFAALQDRATGRYLIRDRTLSLAPSATFYIEALGRDRALESGRRPTALAVGNPRFDRKLLPDLPSLPWAEKEAWDLAALFPGSERLMADDATSEAFLAGADRHEIVQFGGHAVINDEFPLLSYLVMAPQRGVADSGLLYAHEFSGRRFERTRLAVLAACRTAGGPVNGEGPLSLARAFLAAGVPTIVASLWDVDDEATARLLQSFHKRFQQGDDAATALRQAQLSMLASPDTALRSPAAWGAFEVLGAAAPTERK